MKNSQEIDGRKAGSRARWALLSSLIILIIGCIGYFSLPRGLLTFYIFAHLGALGLLGLIGGATGILARKKGRSFSTAFILGSLLPIAAGIIAVVIVVISAGQITCGGSVSFAVAVLVVVLYTLISKKRSRKAGQAG